MRQKRNKPRCDLVKLIEAVTALVRALTALTIQAKHLCIALAVLLPPAPQIEQAPTRAGEVLIAFATS